jgi:hypothetical protein
MPINVQCPNKACAKSMTVKDEFAGKVGKCPACGKPVKVPALAVAPSQQGWDGGPAETDTDTVDAAVSTPNPERSPAPPGSIQAHCRACGKTMNVKIQFAGKVGKCPGCGKPVQVPAAPPAADEDEGIVHDDVEEPTLPKPAHKPPPSAAVGQAIRAQCAGCGKVLNVKPEFAGKIGKCPDCGKPVQVPALGATKRMLRPQIPPVPPKQPSKPEPPLSPFNFTNDEPDIDVDAEVEVETPPKPKPAPKRLAIDEDVEIVDDESLEAEEPTSKRKPAAKKPAHDEEVVNEEEVEVEPPPKRKPAAKKAHDEEVVDEVEVEAEPPPKRKPAKKPICEEEEETADEEAEEQLTTAPKPKKREAKKPRSEEEEEIAEEETENEEDPDRFRRPAIKLELPQMLVIGGIVALVLSSVSLMLPWVSVSGVPMMRGAGPTSGLLHHVGGTMVFFLSVGVAVFAGISLFAVPKLYPWGVLAGAGWSAVAFLWLVIIYLMGASDLADAQAMMKAVKIDISIGIALYLAPLLAGIAGGLFAVPAINVVKELTGKQRGKKPKKRPREPEEDED